MVTTAGHPFLALGASVLAGVLSGYVTAFLQTRMGIQSILAGIIVNTGLYTINFMVMGASSKVNVFGDTTIFGMAKSISAQPWYKAFYKLGIVLLIVILVCVALEWFLNTTMGLSIRATGDNEHMVMASSINPTFTITVGLCVASALTALSGSLLAQYQKSCDINFGTGQVTIALASLMIGESLIKKGSILKRTIGVVLGSCLYRIIVAVALRFNLPAEALKLASAVIVTVAIAAPYLKSHAGLYKRRLGFRQQPSGNGKE
jgi:putative ABC transport system permease protein